MRQYTRDSQCKLISSSIKQYEINNIGNQDNYILYLVIIKVIAKESLMILDQIRTQAKHGLLQILNEHKKIQDSIKRQAKQQKKQNQQIQKSIQQYLRICTQIEVITVEQKSLILLMMRKKQAIQLKLSTFIQQIQKLKNQLDQQEQKERQLLQNASKSIQKNNITQSQIRLLNNAKNKQKKTEMIQKNIKNIKKYDKNVEEHPEYYRISSFVCQKLFEIYKKSTIGAKDIISFDNKQQAKATLNYQKILEMFKEANINLDVNHKLHILRSIKKVCFSQQFITEPEWTKIYKILIHSLGFKQSVFQNLLKSKEQVQKVTKMIYPTGAHSSLPKPLYRTRKIKTESSLNQNKFVNIDSNQILLSRIRQEQSGSKFDTIHPLSKLGNIQDSRTNFNSANNNQHKKLIKNISDIRKQNQIKSQKLIGVQRQRKNHEQTERVDNLDNRNNSYLSNAIKNNRIGKLTWQALFNMTQNNMHFNIVIPQFAREK